jgi:alkanesulfonate monooxygenase SsuD/methylene tetrahydromethanopterin reductase-like flavin-dependent oxidoreductase (luciferase family)
MRLGVGLPNTLRPAADRSLLLDWARTAEAAGFATLATIDKPNYDSWDPLIALAGAAAVTERIRLATTILQLPNRNETLIAKQLASIDVLSNGRVDFGTAVGGREDDFEVFGASMKGRGKRFEQQLDRIRQVWADSHESDESHGVLGPPPVQRPGPPIWLGGMNEETIKRATRLGDAFIFGTAGPDLMTQFTPGIRQWAQEAGKQSYPVYALAYAGIGDDPRQALDRAAAQVLRYYGQLWTEPENLIHHGPPQKIAEDLKKYEASGIDELIVFLEIPDLRQVELLAQARDLAGIARS